jgi:general secretion pathway protein D
MRIRPDYLTRSSPLQRIIALGILSIFTPLLAATRNDKGSKYYRVGQQAEQRREYEKALESYSLALREDPSNPAYEMAARRLRFQVSQTHIGSAKKLRQNGSLDEALAEFRKAFSLDPSNTLAVEEIQRTSETIERNRKGDLKPGDLKLTRPEQEQKQKAERIASILPLPELKPVTYRIAALKMNNQPPRVLYETVAKLAGINAIFDPSVQAPQRNFNLDISNSTLQEALDYLAALTKTYWKAMTSNAIFVTEDNVTKRREYEDQMVKVFYLKNCTSVQEFQETVNAVRSIGNMTHMFTSNAQYAVVARGTGDQMALAEKLFHDLDQPKAEVVVDVVVMQANTARTREIAMSLMSGTTTGLALGLGFSPRSKLATQTSTSSSSSSSATTSSSPSSPSAISAAQIGKIGFSDFSVSLPGALLEAVMSDSTTHIMQSPQVRVSDGQKVTLKIGDRVPYATGSVGVSVGTLNPVLSTQYNFIDTGVNLEVTPHVHSPSEMTLHIAIDISAVSQNVDLGGGLKQPQIGQNKEETEIRVRDGEVNLLGGLTKLQDAKSLAGIPGLVDVPVLGRLFGDDVKSKSRGELLIAIIPHIVRMPDLTSLNPNGVGTGPELTIKLNLAARPESTTTAATTQTAPTQPSPGPPAVVLSPASVETESGTAVALTLSAHNVDDLFSASPIVLKWDPKILRLERIAQGDFLKQDGQNPPIFDIRNDAGEAVIHVARTPGSSGVNGSGTLAQLTFTAIGKGTGTVSATRAVLKNSKQQPIAAALSTAAVTVP